MKILTYDYEYPPIGGGGGWIHSLIAEELAKRHDVDVVTSAYGDLPRTETRNGVGVYRIPVVGERSRNSAGTLSLLSFPPSAWLHAIRFLQGRDYDIVHSHFAVPTGPGGLPIARWLGVPHVLSPHGGDLYDPSRRLSPHRVPPLRWTVDAMLHLSDAVVVASTNTRDNVRRYYRYQGEVEIIPLGIRFPDIDPVPRAELGLPDDTPVAITVGRLVRRKGIQRLLEIVAGLEGDQLELVIVGSGPEHHPLARRAGELGIRDRVHLTGYVEEDRKWQLLQSADMYLSTTMHEGFGLVYLEAMGAGLPIITYDHGGQTDFLEDGRSAYLIPAGDEDAFGRAIEVLLSRPDEGRRMGEQNRRLSADYHSSRAAERYEQLYERLLDAV